MAEKTEAPADLIRALASNLETFRLEKLVIDPKHPGEVYISFEDRLRLVEIITETYDALRTPRRR